MAKKIAVIGGSGFVRKNLCWQLAFKQQDFGIIDIKMSNQSPEKCKINDLRYINTLPDTITGDVVVNLVAVHPDDVGGKTEYQCTNMDRAENVVLVCEENGIDKIVCKGSVVVHGFLEPGTDESGIINPFNEYRRTKFEAEEKLRTWHVCGDKSLLIVLPNVIFGEGNRGNVCNLVNQIASGKFLMVFKGENKKSMAYIGNIAAFLETCIATEQKYGVYKYVDTPDLTMNELVSQVRAKLQGKIGFGLRLPYWLGIVLNYTADLLAKLSNKNFSVSSRRVKKFTLFSEFKTRKASLDNFRTPFLLSDGIEKTLQSELIYLVPNREIFFPECF